jgi:HEAT repeat protein
MSRLALLLLLGTLGSSGLGCSGDRPADLARQLAGDDPLARREAARRLEQMGPEAAEAVPALTDALAHEDEAIRRLASHALGEIGPEARAALPALTDALDDSRLPVRLTAAMAVQRIAPESKAHVPVLIEAMRMGEGGVIVAVGEMGAQATTLGEQRPTWAVPTLIGLLKDRRPGVRRLAAEALGRIAPDAPDVRSALESAAQDPDDRVRAAAREALEHDGA